MRAGSGLRWIAMSLHHWFHLGAGSNGLQRLRSRQADEFFHWRDTLGNVQFEQNRIEISRRQCRWLGEPKRSTAICRANRLMLECMKRRKQVSSSNQLARPLQEISESLIWRM